MNVSRFLISLFVGSLILSCTKDKIVETPAQINGTNLAGASGSSKSWRLVSASYSANGGSSNPITLNSCATDNTFKFSNNNSQDFIQYEGNDGVTGVVKCNSADSTIVEKGNWAFSNDGKSLIVEGEWFDDLTQETQFLFTFTALGESANVVQLTSTTLVVSYSFPFQGSTITVTATFNKV